MAVVFLVVAMLIIAVIRVHTPFGQTAEGKPLGQITLTVRERMLVQRTNLYLIGLVILVSTIAGYLGGPLELVAIVAALAVLLIQCRYTITSQGIAFNNVVFRPWTDFKGYHEVRGGLMLEAVPGGRNFKLHLLGAHRDVAVKALSRVLPATDGARRVGASRHTKSAAKAG